jgi:replication factor C large subunit
LWTEKYRPKKIEEMVGNEEARLRFISWLRDWKEGDKAALLLGPPGTGKTTLVHLVAKEFDMNLIELNASDTRTKDKLVKSIGEALLSSNLFDRSSLLFLDEVDGLAGRADYGAVEFIKDAIKNSKNPIVMAANDPDANQISKLLSSSSVIRFKTPPPREIELYLRNIIENEGVVMTDKDLMECVIKSHGDLRSAINMLQGYHSESTFVEKDLSLSKTQSLYAFFDAKDSASALMALRASSLSPEDKVGEIFKCLVRSPLPREKLLESLEVMSRVDILIGTIRRTQNWRVRRYLDAIFANEILKIIQDEGIRYEERDIPWDLLLRIWNDSKKIRELAKKYSARTHTSIKSALVEDISYLFIMCSSKKFRDDVVKGLDLDEAFEKFLQKESERSV